LLHIIFGTGPRYEDIDQGEFNCPYCQQPRPYTRLRVRHYFRLYFIPVLPLGNGQEMIRCEVCRNHFDPGVITTALPPNKRKVRPLAEQLNTLRVQLADGRPIAYAVAELTAAGLDRDLANDNVRQAIGAERRQCPQCGLTYAPTVEICSEDGTSLVAGNDL
jgi:hypothetical protein